MQGGATPDSSKRYWVLNAWRDTADLFGAPYCGNRPWKQTKLPAASNTKLSAFSGFYCRTDTNSISSAGNKQIAFFDAFSPNDRASSA
jgi:hypothetical protein